MKTRDERFAALLQVLAWCIDPHGTDGDLQATNDALRTLGFWRQEREAVFLWRLQRQYRQENDDESKS